MRRLLLAIVPLLFAAKHTAEFARTTYRVRDLVTGRDLGTAASALATVVPSHDVLVVRLRRM